VPSLFRQIISIAWVNKLAFYGALMMACMLAFIPADNVIHTSMNDKALHAIAFFIFAFLAQLAHPQTRYIVLIVGLAIFGAGIEVVQSYLPYRSFELKDWFADMLGCLAYFVLFSTWFKGRYQQYKFEPD
jgi:VanZ family protein